MSTEIKATVIGSSKIAEAHIKSLNFCEIEINNIATRENSENVKNLVSKYNINQLKNLGWEEIIKNTKSNLIIIANTATMHEEIAKFALNNGKYVLCEKPGWDLSNDPSCENKQNIRFSYNRRYYSWIQNFKKLFFNLEKNLW